MISAWERQECLTVTANVSKNSFSRIFSFKLKKFISVMQVIEILRQVSNQVYDNVKNLSGKHQLFTKEKK